MINRHLTATGVLLLIHAVFPALVVASSSYAKPEPGELRSVPDTHPKSYLTARDHLTVGDTLQARRLLSRSLKRFPHHAPSQTLYLKLRHQTGGTFAVFKAVQNQYERTVRSDLFVDFFRSTRGDTASLLPVIHWLNDRDVNPYFSRVLARHHLDRGDAQGAVDLLEGGLESFPEDSKLRLLYARGLARLGKCHRALEQTNRLLRRRPGWAEPYRLKAGLLGEDRGNTVRKLLEAAEHLSGSPTPSEKGSFDDVSCPDPEGSSKEYS